MGQAVTLACWCGGWEPVPGPGSEPLVPDCRTAMPAASAGLTPYPKALLAVAVNAPMPFVFSVPFSTAGSQ